MPLEVYPQLSPRLIISDEVELTMQELVDQANDWESLPANGSYPHLVESNGKVDLGGGTLTGINAILQNAVLGFAQITAVVSAGTVTSVVTGFETRRLKDSAATFVSDNVQPGMIVLNESDLSIGTVIQVIGEDELLHLRLGGGVSNDWEVGDGYRIWDVQQRNAGGGNLAAVNDLGSAIDPIHPTFGTHVTRTAASGSTINDVQLQTATKYLIESLRPDHGAFGSIWYWDPISGNDANDGVLPSSAVKTWAAVNALVVAGRNDSVYVINESGAQLVINDRIVMNKAGTHVRADGSVVFMPTSGTAPVIDVSADNCSIEAFTAVALPGVTHCIRVVGCDGFRANDFRLIGSGTGAPTCHGVEIDGGDSHLLESRFLIEEVSGDGVLVGDATDVHVSYGRVSNVGGWGVEITSTTPGDCHDVNVDHVYVDTCGSGGIHVGSGVEDAVISRDSYVSPRMLVRTLDEGTRTQHALVDEQAPIRALAHKVENLRSTHSSTGRVVYWDPVDGDDSNSGETPSGAVKTWTRAHDLVDDYGEDTIQAVAPPQASVTVGPIAISKNYVHLRGPGGRFKIVSPDDTSDAITVTGNNCEVSYLSARTQTSGTPRRGISATGGDVLINAVDVDQGAGDGIYLEGDNNRVRNCVVDGLGGDGILAHDCGDATLERNRVRNCTGWGVYLEATSPGATHGTTLADNDVYDCAGGYVGQDTDVAGTHSMGPVDHASADENLTSTKAEKRLAGTDILIIDKDVVGGTITDVELVRA